MATGTVEIQGLDVSVFQGSVDWEKVRRAGKEFVMIRLGWCGFNGGIQSNGGLDKNFTTNIRGALAAGMKVGIYVYSYATSAQAARAAALETLALLEGYDVAYPVAFDMEDTGQAGYQNNGKAFNSAIANAFLTAIEGGGYTPVLYTYKSFAENYLDMSGIPYDLWLAQFNSTVTYKGDYTIWQYTDAGTCDGISGTVDLDVAYVDYAVSDPKGDGDSDGDGGSDGNGGSEGDGGSEEDITEIRLALWSQIDVLVRRLLMTF